MDIPIVVYLNFELFNIVEFLFCDCFEVYFVVFIMGSEDILGIDRVDERF